MGQQHNKTIKRRRLKAYLARKKQRERSAVGSTFNKKVPSTKRNIKKP